MNNRCFRTRNTPFFGHSIEESPFFIYIKANFGIGVLCVCVCGGEVGGEELAVRETRIIRVFGNYTVLWASNSENSPYLFTTTQYL